MAQNFRLILNLAATCYPIMARAVMAHYHSFNTGKKKASHISVRRLNEYGSYLLSRIVVQYHRPWRA